MVYSKICLLICLVIYMSDNTYDWTDIIKKLFKYLVVGLVMALAINYVPEQKLKMKDVITLSLIAAVVYAGLDMFSPSVVVN
jgi:hypothetical protein